MTALASDIAVVRDAEQAAAMANPLRLRVLESLTEGDSASGVARRLGEPRQKVNFHLRELERVGLVDFVEERKRGNCLERIVRAKAAHFVVSPEALGPLGDVDPSQMQDRFSWAYLVAVVGRAIRDLAQLRAGADRANKKLATFSLETEVCFESPQAMKAFAEDLSNAVARVVALHHTEPARGGRWFRFFVGGHPAAHRGTHAPSGRSPHQGENE